MKQLLILSGKGGTGKTTIASSFIHLSKAKQFADCDVEAPNLHLIYQDGTHQTKPYHGLSKAVINQDLCIHCGLCHNHCKFNAINFEDRYTIDPYKCEGCGVCDYVCPVNAISFIDTVDGSVDLFQSDLLFSTGKLKMGSGNSGLLVTEVKKQLDKEAGFTIIDGPPGIGCPVIASISGVDFILLVTEASMSGFSDLRRMIETIRKTKIKMAVCINKYDINFDISNIIEKYLQDQNIDYVGHIAYSSSVNQMINEGKIIVDSDLEVGNQIRKIYEKVIELI